MRFDLGGGGGLGIPVSVKSGVICAHSAKLKTNELAYPFTSSLKINIRESIVRVTQLNYEGYSESKYTSPVKIQRIFFFFRNGSAAM
jgi:hypothetical protein